jgi:hypothetical protein
MGIRELEVLVHCQGAKPHVVAAALTDTSGDVLVRITADAVLVRGGAKWGLQ